jgi:Tol biopolymer transport system component
VRRLTHNQVTETAPAYSPDGRSIAFVRAGGVWVMASNGHNPHLLFRAPTISGYEGGLDWGQAP